MIKNMDGLEELSLNLRSWGYSNPKVTNVSLTKIGEALTNKNSLKKLYINLYCWGYENPNVNEEGLIYMVDQIYKNDKSLEEISFNLDGWSSDFKNEANLMSVSDQGVERLFENFEKSDKLKKFYINLSSWGWKNNKITDRSLIAIGSFLSYRGQQLTELEINLKVWWNSNQVISMEGIMGFCEGLSHC